jgi:hypothetical protein
MGGYDEALPMKRNAATWTAFLVMAFAVVGLVGAFATYAAQIPFERALARSEALDQAVAISRQPDAHDRLQALRDALGDSAGPVLDGKGHDATGDMKSRTDAERIRMLQAFGHESEDIGMRLRIVIAVFAAGAALFGAAVLGIAQRSE